MLKKQLDYKDWYNFKETYYDSLTEWIHRKYCQSKNQLNIFKLHFFADRIS